MGGLGNMDTVNPPDDPVRAAAKAAVGGSVMLIG